MENFLSLRECMVIFTSPDLASTLLSMRPPGLPTVVRPLPMSQFLMSRLLTKQQWRAQVVFVLRHKCTK